MRKIIDSHLHIINWREGDFISCFDSYVKKNELSAINICSVPFERSNVSNNVMLGLYKLACPNTYVHAGIELLEIPIDNMPSDMDAVTQYRELMEIGFDGIKMLEGKPNEHKRVGGNLNHPSLNALYAEMERDGTHLLMHVNDPDEFWDLKRAPQWAIDKGWTYTDGTFASYEEIQRQTIKILEDYPRLSLTLAHFFFCSKTPELLEKLRVKFGSADYVAASPMMRQCLVKVVNEDLTHLLPGIKAPTLLVWGENDTATPLSDAKKMEAEIPDAGLAIIKNAGHFSFVEQPVIFGSIMASFFELG
jgi:hypothetical protein